MKKKMFGGLNPNPPPAKTRAQPTAPKRQRNEMNESRLSFRRQKTVFWDFRYRTPPKPNFFCARIVAYKICH